MYAYACARVPFAREKEVPMCHNHLNSKQIDLIQSVIKCP